MVTAKVSAGSGWAHERRARQKAKKSACGWKGVRLGVRLDGQFGVLVRSPKNTSVKEPFQGPIIPFGPLVAYHPISTKDQSRIHQFGKKVLPGIFLGYVLYAGRIWKGDILIVDLEELKEMNASETMLKRLNAKEVITPKSGENTYSPSLMKQ